MCGLQPAARRKRALSAQLTNPVRSPVYGLAVLGRWAPGRLWAESRPQVGVPAARLRFRAALLALRSLVGGRSSRVNNGWAA